MVLIQKEIKKVTIRPNGVEKQIRPPQMRIDFLLVGGGGAGFGHPSINNVGSGGGGGGVVYCEGFVVESNSSYNIIIGCGGHACSGGRTCPGGDSCFDSIIACGGGEGKQNLGGCSGGLIGGCNRTCGGSGISQIAGGGGGGASCAGCVGTCATYGNGIGGNGGDGLCFDISGECCRYSGGGGGGGRTYNGRTGVGGTGGCGGGGTGGYGGYVGCCATYYGGGGGGGGCYAQMGGCGYQGVFIARYPTACGYNISGGTCYTCGDYTIHCFTSDGTLTVN